MLSALHHQFWEWNVYQKHMAPKGFLAKSGHWFQLNKPLCCNCHGRGMSRLSYKFIFELSQAPRFLSSKNKSCVNFCWYVIGHWRHRQVLAKFLIRGCVAQHLNSICPEFTFMKEFCMVSLKNNTLPIFAGSHWHSLRKGSTWFIKMLFHYPAMQHCIASACQNHCRIKIATNTKQCT